MTTRHTGHTKRLAAPKRYYPLLRKEKKYVVKISAGPYSYKNGIPLLLLLREILRYTKNVRETKKVLNAGKIIVDGKIRKDFRFPIGLMDVVSIPSTKENYRVLFDKHGYIKIIKISDEEARLKLCKIINKTVIKNNRIQLNLHDGKNIIVDENNYVTGDSILISIPKLEIKKRIPLEKGVNVFVTEGKHSGETAILEDFKPQMGTSKDKVLLVNEAGEKFETLKKYVFVIGKEKTEIKIKGE